jgi:DNA-binding CsgD family transcriptional regulator
LVSVVTRMPGGGLLPKLQPMTETVSHGELVGRAKERATLADAIRSARQHAVMVLVQGEAGIGKTVLINRCAGEAQSAGFVLFRVAAHPDGASIAFSPLTDLLPQLTSLASREQLDVLLGSNASSAPPSILALAANARSSVMEGFTEALAREAEKGPIVLTVEDLHWSEPSVSSALRSIRRRLHDLPILIVATTRPVAGLDLADEIQLLEDASDRVLDLGPLSSDQSQLLASRLIGRSANELVSHDQVPWPRCNPLVIHQWAYDVQNGRGVATDPPGEDPIRSSTEGRLALLPAACLELARIIAVFGREVAIEELHLLANLNESLEPVDVEGLRSIVDVVNESGLVCVTDTHVKFTHDLIRDAVLSHCPMEKQAELHHHVVKLLTDQGASPGVIASHLAAQQRLGNSETEDETQLRQDWLMKASDSAAGAAPGLAAKLLEQALAGVDTADPLFREQFISLVGLYGSCGRLADSERIAIKLLATDLAPHQDLMVRWWLASVLFASGRLAEGRSVAEAGLAAAADPLTRARLSAVNGLIALLQIDSGFRDALERADRDSQLVDDPSSQTIVASIRTWSHLMNLDLPGAIGAAEQAVRVADSDESGLAHRYQPVLFHAFALLDNDDHRGLERVLAIGRRRAAQTGTSWAESLYLAVDALRALRMGQFDDALANARASLAVIDETGVWVGAVLSHSVIAQVCLARADTEGARRSISEAHYAQGNDRMQFGTDLLTAAEAELAASEGSLIQGLNSIVEAAEFLLLLGFRTASFEVIQPVFRLLLELPVAERADWLDRLDALTAHPSEPAILVPLRAWFRALRFGTEAAWNEAIAAVDTQGWKWRQAIVRLGAAIDATTAEKTAGNDSAATRWQREATERLQAMTATAALSLLLKQTGKQSGKHSSKQSGRVAVVRPSHSTLSPAERIVARCISDGLSNRDIAEQSGQSIRTVESHVSAVLRKLGVTSRAKVAARLRN